MAPPLTNELSREEVNSLKGATLLEFGAEWCGYCQAAQPMIASALALFPYVQHIKIEDGKGKKLGRLFNVKLWPTLIFMTDGIERKRLVRQINADELSASLQLIRPH